ncbi:tetratricopeptide repeat protein [Pseudomonadota bacterium]
MIDRISFSGLIAALSALLFLVPGFASAAAPSYAGATVCNRCHESESGAWQGSHHDLAMQAADESTVLGSFDDTEFVYYGVKNRFFRKDGRFFVNTEDANGERADFEFKYTFGVLPLQQYLVEFEDGRLQAFPVAWDSRAKEDGGQHWFHLYPDENIGPGDPLYWTGPNQNWNFMCAECHSTNLQRNYDPETDTYDTTWSEINVSCEACHGPGSAHVEWAESNPGSEADYGLQVDLGRRGNWVMNRETGVARNSSPGANAQVETCARCHSRRIVLSEDYEHGKPLAYTYRPQVLLEGLYHSDGQILDEVYVYGSFIQSRMYKNGVVCSDCHDPHSLDLRAEGNALCGTCHQPASYDTADHHFHAPAGEAGQCVTCHMPSRVYMVNDPRRDHSFRVPRPDLADSAGSPDVCTGCHLGRSPQWAAESILEHSGIQAREGHFGEALQAARTGSLDAQQKLLALADDREQPSIARATAAAMLGPYLSPTTVQTLAVLLRDSDPLVRVNAISALDGADPRLKVQMLPRLLEDPYLMVRIEVAQAMADIPGDLLSSGQRENFGRAVDEYIQVQQNNADRVESWINLGNLFQRLGNSEKALPYYQRGLELDPLFAPAYVNLADLYRAQGKDDAAARLLMEGKEKLPDAGSIRHAYGLLLVRQNKLEDALVELRRSVELEPGNTRFRYVYAIGLSSSGKSEAALNELESANASNPGDVNVLAALVDFLRQAGEVERARGYAEDLVRRVPWDRSAKALLQQLSP